MAYTESQIKKMLPKTYYRSYVAHELCVAITYFKSLVPVLDRYYYKNGTAKTLVCLTGTLPTRFSGKIYNIPVCIWIEERYPRSAPICFVKPTNEMILVKRVFLSSDGEVTVPYLQDWKTGDCDLVGLLQVLVTVFEEFPPVCVRPQPETEQHHQSGFMIHKNADGSAFILLPGEDSQPLEQGVESNC